jgi:uncharacterized protein YheU (UPF0270 family)
LDDYIEIPADQLSATLLQAVMEDYITREGTDYGHREYSLDEKVVQLQLQLQQGHIFIAYDPLSESCTLIARD